MFKVEISIRFIDIVTKSCDLLQTYDQNLNPLFKKYQ